MGMVWILVVGILAWAPRAAADDVTLEGKKLEKVRVVDFDGGILHVRLSSGADEFMPFTEVVSLTVDRLRGMDDFNEAESLRQVGRHADSLLGYRKALSKAAGYWRPIIQVRLLQVYDELDQFERSGELYLNVLPAVPDLGLAVMPRNIPAKKSSIHQKYLDDIRRQLTAADNEKVRIALESFRFRILERIGDPAAGESARRLAGTTVDSGNEPRNYAQIRVAAIRVEIAAKERQSALEHIDEAIDQASLQDLPELLWLKGSVLGDLADSPEKMLAAALVFIRVDVFFPNSPFAPKAVYETAVLHERAGLPRTAASLYSRVAKSDRAEPDLKTKAAEALKRLQAAGK